MSNAPLSIINYNTNNSKKATVDTLRNNYPITEYRNQPQKKNYQLQSLNYVYPQINLENNKYNMNHKNNINNMKKVPIIQTNIFPGQNNNIYNNYNNNNNKNNKNNINRNKKVDKFRCSTY